MNFLKWLGQFVTGSQTTKPSVKRFGLALTVTVLCGVMFGLGVVMSIAAINSLGRDQVDIIRICAETIQWVSTALLTAVSGSYVADKALARGKTSDSSN